MLLKHIIATQGCATAGQIECCKQCKRKEMINREARVWHMLIEVYAAMAIALSIHLRLI